MKVYVPSLKRQLIAVSWPWFSQYIYTEFWAIQDGYIAEYESARNEMNLIGARTFCGMELSDLILLKLMSIM